jgi:hypothetical protein
MSVAADTSLEAPFLGLRYFDEEQSHLFFGRDVQVNDILEKLRWSRFVTVMGSSGSGKSSLVRAGVVPSLKAGFFSDAGPRWRIAKMRPGSSPILNLGRELEKVLSVPGIEVTLRRGPLGLVQAVEECRLPAEENVLVLADQFEELFRYQRESDHAEAAKEEAAAFVKLLLEATNQRALPIHVVVTMRSDYLGNCAQFRDLPERINDGLYLVPRMRRDQLEQAITGPVAVEDAAITPRLVQKLLNDTGDDPDQLPVLQHALLRAWIMWNEALRPLDLEDLDAVGGMKESLSRHADEIFDGLSADQKRIARVVFQQLSDRDAEGREIRRPAPVRHIAAVAGVTAEAVEGVVKKFAAPDAGLLYRNEDGHIDITHESLIRKWRLIQGTKLQGLVEAKGWMQEEVEARDQFQLLAERARQKDTLMGRALEDALRWRALGLNADWARRYAKVTGAGSSFQDVQLFIAECQTKDRRRRRLRTWLILGAVQFTAVFVGVILILWQSALRQKALAMQQEARALQALRVSIAWDYAEREPGVSVAFLREIVNPERVRGWRGAAVKVLKTLGTSFSVELRHASAIRSAEFSPDGTTVVTASQDHTARLWTADGRPVGSPLMHSAAVTTAKFSPDGRLVYTASADDTARVWDATSGRLLIRLNHDAAVTTISVSPDAQRVLTTSRGVARVWDAATGLEIARLAGHADAITSAVFSPDGTRILTASLDGTARLSTGVTGESTIFRGHSGPIFSAKFSPDMQAIITASEDISVRIWSMNAN